MLMTQAINKVLNKVDARIDRADFYLIVCTLYIFIRIMGTSLYKNGGTEGLFKICLWAIYFAMAGKILMDFLYNEYSIKETCVLATISFLLFVNMRTTGIKDAFIYWIFIIGSKGTDYKKVMKWAAIAHFAALFSVIGGCSIHVLDNVIYLHGNRIRESLGFTYTTEPANFFFYAVLIWLYFRNKKIQWAELILLIIVDVFIFKKTGTQSAFTLTLMAIFIFAAVKSFPWVGSWKVGYSWLTALIVPFMVGFIFYTTCRYDPSASWLNKLDRLLNSRLQLGQAALEKYGIPVLGQQIRWIGGANAHWGRYNYVDSSFVQILVNYGWVFFCLLIIGLLFYEKAISDHQDFYLMIVFGMLVIHATFDPQLIWIMFNSFWLAYPFVTETGTEQHVTSEKPNYGQKIIFITVAIGIATLGVFFTGLNLFLNKALYLDGNHPGYVNQLLEAESEYGSSTADGDGAYLLTMVDKEGFGEVTPEDILFFVKASQRMNPDIVRTSLCFSDSTGIEIPVTQPERAKYGDIDARGRVVGDSKSVDLVSPLLGQIDGVTFLEREYDEDMNLIYQFRRGADGNGIEDYDGNAGFYRVYDKRHHIVSHKNIGMDKQPNVNRDGFSEFRREYNGEDLIWEGYFDADGRPVERRDCLYAAISKEYDQKHNCIDEKYFDIAGNRICSSFGYAEIRREYTERKISKESFFDTEGRAVMVPEGYASRYFGYDEYGKINSEIYMDVNGAPVITTLGYAEVHRTYEGSDLITEKYYGTDGLPLLIAGGYAGILQKWEDGTLMSRTYLDAEGNPVERKDGYSSASWQQDAKGVKNVQFSDLSGKTVSLEGHNLVTDLKTNSDGWSAWMTPQKDIDNSGFIIGYANLGKKAEGEPYTCQLEIEFKDVSSTPGEVFRFSAQGAQDGKWTADNVWNGSLINLNSVPKDGIYLFTSTKAIHNDMLEISRFDLGFRCDYWASGSFRVRNVKVEKGDTATEWSPGS